MFCNVHKRPHGNHAITTVIVAMKGVTFEDHLSYLMVGYQKISQ